MRIRAKRHEIMITPGEFVNAVGRHLPSKSVSPQTSDICLLCCTIPRHDAFVAHLNRPFRQMYQSLERTVADTVQAKVVMQRRRIAIFYTREPEQSTLLRMLLSHRM